MTQPTRAHIALTMQIPSTPDPHTSHTAGEDLRRLLDRAKAGFEQAFGQAPTVAAYAPGRANLIGEHTDYSGGLVLPCAIQLGCVAVASAGGRGVEAAACDLGETASLASAPATPHDVSNHPSWFRYVAGAHACASRRLPEIPRQLRVALASSVPSGSGLSSSAALAVAVVRAMEGLAGSTMDSIDRARSAREAETDFAGVPCGIMDQLASVLGRPGEAVRIDCRSMRTSPVPLPAPEQASLLLFDTTVRHDNSDGAYAARRRACDEAASTLGVGLLRDLPALSEVSLRSLTADQADAVRHVLSENARVDAFVAASRAGDLHSAGRAMTESHISLRDVFGVSCRESDELVELLLGQRGVLGARMTGAGFGGWVLALIDASHEADVAAETTASFARLVDSTPRCIPVRASGGARLIEL